MRKNMKTIQVISRNLILLAIAFLLAGCLISKPTNNDIAGLWIEHPIDNEISQPCGTFEFFDDGRFEAKNIPSKYFMSIGNLPERFSASGTWVLDVSSNEPFAVHQIKLGFAPLDGFPLGFDSILYIAVDGGSLFGGVEANILFTKGEKCE
jgi:hypothetical protein